MWRAIRISHSNECMDLATDVQAQPRSHLRDRRPLHAGDDVSYGRHQISASVSNLKTACPSDRALDRPQSAKTSTGNDDKRQHDGEPLTTSGQRNGGNNSSGELSDAEHRSKSHRGGGGGFTRSLGRYAKKLKSQLLRAAVGAGKDSCRSLSTLPTAAATDGQTATASPLPGPVLVQGPAPTSVATTAAHLPAVKAGGSVVSADEGRREHEAAMAFGHADRPLPRPAVAAHSTSQKPTLVPAPVPTPGRVATADMTTVQRLKCWKAKLPMMRKQRPEKKHQFFTGQEERVSPSSCRRSSSAVAVDKVTSSAPMLDESNYDIPTGPYQASAYPSLSTNGGGVAPATATAATSEAMTTSCSAAGSKACGVAYSDEQRWCSSVAFPVESGKVIRYYKPWLAESQPLGTCAENDDGNNPDANDDDDVDDDDDDYRHGHSYSHENSSCSDGWSSCRHGTVAKWPPGVVPRPLAFAYCLPKCMFYGEQQQQQQSSGKPNGNVRTDMGRVESSVSERSCRDMATSSLLIGMSAAAKQHQARGDRANVADDRQPGPTQRQQIGDRQGDGGGQTWGSGSELPPPVNLVSGYVVSQADHDQIIRPSAFRPFLPAAYQPTATTITRRLTFQERTALSAVKVMRMDCPEFVVETIADCNSGSQGGNGSGAAKNGCGQFGDKELSLQELNRLVKQLGSNLQRGSAAGDRAAKATTLYCTTASTTAVTTTTANTRDDYDFLAELQKFDGNSDHRAVHIASGPTAVATLNDQTNLAQSRQSASRSSRNSSGIQVTPSPSDVETAELELALKEKDAELCNLRQTMEHNEQVIIRVYQEKEERWQEKLREWSARLQALMDNEQKLFSDIRYLQCERSDLTEKVNGLMADKQGLQKKCRELEKELFDLREQLNNKTKQWSICHRCSNIFMPNVLPESEKKFPFSPNGIRNELEALRMEVSQLRQSLHLQIN